LSRKSQRRRKAVIIILAPDNIMVTFRSCLAGLPLALTLSEKLEVVKPKILASSAHSSFLEDQEKYLLPIVQNIP
jgi:hypothetical protein